MAQFTPFTVAMLAFVEAQVQLDIAAKPSGCIPEPMRVSAYSLSHDFREGVAMFQVTHDETARHSASSSNPSPDDDLLGPFTSGPISMDTSLLDLWATQH